jgi:hypothetical protein
LHEWFSVFPFLRFSVFVSAVSSEVILFRYRSI